MNTKEILNAPVSSAFKAALLEARRGWIVTSGGAVRTGYRHAGATLARQVRTSDYEDELVDAVLPSEGLPDTPDEEQFKALHESAAERALAWLKTHRSRYLDMVPARRRMEFAEGFAEELESEYS